MEFSENHYGEVFADVYDDWYQGLDDIDVVVDFVVHLADNCALLELGVGTGRLAVPIARVGADHGIKVVGVDSSPAMLDVLQAKPGGTLVEVRLGHMVRDMPSGTFGLVLIAYNTLFNLLGDGEQRECLLQASKRLSPGGHIVVDCFVPNESLPDQPTDVVHRDLAADQVLSRWAVDRDNQIIRGVFTQTSVDFNDISRPYAVRYATVAQIDEIARAVGLVVEQRWSSYARDEFDDYSPRHITVYGLAAATT